MNQQQSPEVLKLIAHDLRWNMLKALTIGDYRVQELAALTHEPINLVSYHLKKLRDDGLVNTRRGDADGRDIYYSLDADRLRDLYLKAGATLHPALSLTKVAPFGSNKSSQSMRILFVCTHNSARSQMAEGLVRHLAGDLVEAYSAGSHPTQLHADAIYAMDELGIDIRTHKSKSLEWFENQTFDYAITVCDRAREICPVFPGECSTIHWSFADPAAVADPNERRELFLQTAQRLKSRIEYWLVSVLTKAPT